MLECLYDMEGDALYSVKWYRNGKEFYRHIPSDSPPTAVFRQPGLVVDVSQSQAVRNLSVSQPLHFRNVAPQRQELSSTESSSTQREVISVRSLEKLHSSKPPRTRTTCQL